VPKPTMRRVGTDFAAMAPWTRSIDDPKLPCALELVLDLEGARVVCRSLRMIQREGGPTIAPSTLRQLPLANIITRSAPPMLGRIVGRSGGGVQVRGGGLSPADALSLLKQLRLRRADRAIQPEDLRLVATAVELAKATGAPTGEAVRQVMEVSPTRARALIQQARDEIDPESGEPYLQRESPSRSPLRKKNR
jgi:hypothetical protein